MEVMMEREVVGLSGSLQKNGAHGEAKAVLLSPSSRERHQVC